MSEERGITLAEMEELILKHEHEGVNKVRSKGQIEATRELRNIAFSDISNLMYEDETGTLRLKKLTDLPMEVTASIKKIKVNQVKSRAKRVYDSDGNEDDNPVVTGEVVEIELWDKMGALNMLMKHYGGYETDNKQKSDALGQRLDTLLGSIGNEGLPKLEHDPFADMDFSEEEDMI